MKDLPENAKKYIYALEDFIGAKVCSISTSEEKTQFWSRILLKFSFLAVNFLTC